MATGIKTGGRTIGTPNKTTKEIRNVLKNLINNELENIETVLDAMDSKERLQVVIKLIPYILPKIENVNPNYGESANWDID